MATIEKGSLYLFVSRIVFFVTGYLLYIILGRFLLTPEQFGTFGVVIGLVGITNVLLAKGIQQSVSRFVSTEGNPDAVKFKAFKIGFLLAGLIFIIYFLLAPLLAQLFNEPSMALFIQVSAVSVFFEPLSSIVRGFLNGQKRFKAEAIFAMSKRSLRLAVPIMFVLLGFSLFGVFAGIALAAVLSFSLGLAITGSPIKGRGARFSSKALLAFSLPVIIFSFLQSLLTQLDVFFVKALVAEGSIAGYYVAAVTLGKMPYEAITVISLILFPLVSQTTFKKNPAKTGFYISHSLRYLLLFIIPVTLIASVTALPLIKLFYGSAYAQGAGPLALLALAYLFLAVFTIATTIIVANGKPKQALIIGAIALALNAALNYLLVPVFGMNGAATATLVSMCAAALIALALVFAEFRIFPFKSAVKILIATAVALAASTVISFTGLMLLVEYAVLLVIYAVVLFALGEIKESDFAVARNAFA